MLNSAHAQKRIVSASMKTQQIKVPSQHLPAQS